jgi:hypothetical protein
MQAKMPNAAGTFVGVGASVGSTNSAGQTQMVFALYDSTSGGEARNIIFSTAQFDSTLKYADPAALMTLDTLHATSTKYSDGFTGALSANAIYWVYMQATTENITGQNKNTAGRSTGPCAGAHWTSSVPPPGADYYTAPTDIACPAAFNLYMIVSFP